MHISISDLAMANGPGLQDRRKMPRHDRPYGQYAASKPNHSKTDTGFNASVWSNLAPTQHGDWKKWERAGEDRPDSPIDLRGINRFFRHGFIIAPCPAFCLAQLLRSIVPY